MDSQGAGARGGHAGEAVAGSSTAATEADADQPQWFPVGDISAENGYPGVISTLLESQRRGSNSGVLAFDILATISNAVMIESGFVPVVGENEQPLRTATEVKGMEEEERMTALIGDLQKIIEIQETLRRVTYRYIVVDESKVEEARKAASSTDKKKVGTKVERPPVFFKGNFKYGDSEVVHVIMKDEFGIRLGMSTTTGNTSVTLSFSDILPLAQSANLDLMSFTPMDFLLKGEFNAPDFSYLMKKPFIFPILDRYQALSGEFRGLCTLPPEILIALAKRMDIRTFLSFAAANDRNWSALRHCEEVWKCMYMSLNMDLEEYGLPIPMNSSVRPGGPITYELAYQASYEDALEMKKEQEEVPQPPTPPSVPQFNRIRITGGLFPFSLY